MSLSRYQIISTVVLTVLLRCICTCSDAEVPQPKLPLPDLRMAFFWTDCVWRCVGVGKAYFSGDCLRLMFRGIKYELVDVYMGILLPVHPFKSDSTTNSALYALLIACPGGAQLLTILRALSAANLQHLTYGRAPTTSRHCSYPGSLTGRVTMPNRLPLMLSLVLTDASAQCQRPLEHAASW